MISYEMLESIFDEDELDAFVHGECMDFALGLSKAMQDVPHRLAVLLAPEGRKMVIAHVAIEIDGVYYDAAGRSDRIDLLIHWSWVSGIEANRFSFEFFQSADQVRQLAKKLGCEFESDCKENADRVFKRLEEVLLKSSPSSPQKSNINQIMELTSV